MRFGKIAQALLAACYAMPVAAQITATPAPFSGALGVWFKAPLAGATIKGVLNGGTNCYANASGGVARVQFFVDSTALNTDSTPADGMQCALDTTGLANGAHQLKAVAYDAAGSSREDVIAVNVQNPVVTPTPTPTTAGSATPAPLSGSLDVWFKAPAAGATIKGQLNGGTSCYVAASGSISRVQFTLDGTPLNTDSTPGDGIQCSLDTTKFANGTHQLAAIAYDASGASRMDVIAVNLQNAAVTSAPSATSTTPAPGAGALDVWFKSPTAGVTISGMRTGTQCYVAGAGATRVAFFMDGTPLNTDTTMSDGMQCVLDTTKFANGLHTLMASAYDATGRRRDDVISVNVQNAASATPTPTAGAPTANPASLLFRSGFEGATTFGAPLDCYTNGCWQNPSGTDSSTGFTWPPRIYGGSSRVQLLTNAAQTPTPTTARNWMFNEVRPGEGRNGSNALFMQVSQSGCCGTAAQGSNSTQDALYLLPSSDATDLYVSYWLMLPTDLPVKIAGAWRNIFEIKTADQANGGPDWRYLIQAVGWNGPILSWRVLADRSYPSGGTFWDVLVPSVAVPLGQWFKLEVYWHRSSGSDGRFWAAVNGVVLDDHRGPNMGAARAPMDRIMLTNLYTGGTYPQYQWLDDLQVWSAFPTANSGDAWYDPPYAPH